MDKSAPLKGRFVVVFVYQCTLVKRLLVVERELSVCSDLNYRYLNNYEQSTQKWRVLTYAVALFGRDLATPHMLH